MKYIDLYIDNELVHYMSFMDEMDEIGTEMYDVLSSSPKVYLIDYYKDVPKKGSLYYGEKSEENFILGDNYGISLFFIFTIDNVVRYVMPLQYTKENELLVAVLASNPTLLGRKDG